jgi:hypothetical protein
MRAEKLPPLVPLPSQPARSSAITPTQLWSQLTPSQQQHVRQTIVMICQQWLATMASDTTTEGHHE